MFFVAMLEVIVGNHNVKTKIKHLMKMFEEYLQTGNLATSFRLCFAIESPYLSLWGSQLKLPSELFPPLRFLCSRFDFGHPLTLRGRAIRHDGAVA